MKTRFLIPLLISCLLCSAFTQNQLKDLSMLNNAATYTKQISNIENIYNIGAKIIKVYKFNGNGDSLLYAEHNFTFKDEIITKIQSILYDSCNIISSDFLLPLGNYFTYYTYDSKGLVSEIVCINSSEDTMERILFTIDKDSTEYIYQKIKNNYLTNESRMVFYKMNSKMYMDILDEYYYLYWNRFNTRLYYSDSVKVYNWNNNEWKFNMKILFDFNSDSTLLNLYSICPYNSSSNAYFYDTLFYDNLNNCYKIISSIDFPLYEVKGKLSGYSYTKDNNSNIIEKNYFTYDEVFPISIYGYRHYNIYENNNIIKELIFQATTENNWEPYSTIEYIYQVDIPESIKRISNFVFPNPTSKQLYINNSDVFIQVVIIYNIMGREINRYSVNNTQTTLDVSNLPAGMYIVKIQTEQGVLTRKVQIIR